LSGHGNANDEEEEESGGNTKKKGAKTRKRPNGNHSTEKRRQHRGHKEKVTGKHRKERKHERQGVKKKWVPVGFNVNRKFIEGRTTGKKGTGAFRCMEATKRRREEEETRKQRKGKGSSEQLVGRKRDGAKEEPPELRGRKGRSREKRTRHGRREKKTKKPQNRQQGEASPKASWGATYHGVSCPRGHVGRGEEKSKLLKKRPLSPRGVKGSINRR